MNLLICAMCLSEFSALFTFTGVKRGEGNFDYKSAFQPKTMPKVVYVLNKLSRQEKHTYLYNLLMHGKSTGDGTISRVSKK